IKRVSDIGSQPTAHDAAGRPGVRNRKRRRLCLNNSVLVSSFHCSSRGQQVRPAVVCEGFLSCHSSTVVFTVITVEGDSLNALGGCPRIFICVTRPNASHWQFPRLRCGAESYRQNVLQCPPWSAAPGPHCMNEKSADIQRPTALHQLL